MRRIEAQGRSEVKVIADCRWLARRPTAFARRLRRVIKGLMEETKRTASCITEEKDVSQRNSKRLILY